MERLFDDDTESSTSILAPLMTEIDERVHTPVEYMNSTNKIKIMRRYKSFQYS